ncbi:MAG: helix-turn-helix domain-containing protein [Crocosphaera sp.]|nr:helix-turn-helix domain-containing protein [Crocosphaera sp.]
MGNQNKIIKPTADLYLSYSYYDEIDLFAQYQRYMNFDRWQIIGNKLQATVLNITSDQVLCSYRDYNCSSRFEGINLPNYWLFWIPFRPLWSLFENKYDLQDNYLLYGSPNTEFTLLEKSFSTTYAFHIRDTYLVHLCEHLNLPKPAFFLETKSIPSVGLLSSTQMQYLRFSCFLLYKTMLNLNQSNDKNQRQILVKNLRQILTEKIPIQILLYLAKNCNIQPEKIVIKKRSLLEKAEEYMINHWHKDIVTADICQEVGVSQRTLEYTFNHYYNISPKAYLKKIRLNKFHQALLGKDIDISIKELAEQFGFLHRGHLARDYKKLFGKLPSQSTDN